MRSNPGCFPPGNPSKAQACLQNPHPTRSPNDPPARAQSMCRATASQAPDPWSRNASGHSGPRATRGAHRYPGAHSPRLAPTARWPPPAKRPHQRPVPAAMSSAFWAPRPPRGPQPAEVQPGARRPPEHAAPSASCACGEASARPEASIPHSPRLAPRACVEGSGPPALHRRAAPARGHHPPCSSPRPPGHHRHTAAQPPSREPRAGP